VIAGGAPTRVLVERADSVAGVSRALGRIWDELGRAGLIERRVGERITSLARTRVMTLIVVAARPETVERAMDAMRKLAGRHPSRTLVLALGDPTGPPTVEARIEAHCHPFGGSSEVCTEEILLRLGGEACQHPAAAAAPLVLHDLPVALWWTDDPPMQDRRFAELTAAADRLVIDCGAFRGDGRDRLAELAAEAAAGREVHDLGWMRLEPWRSVLASLFDDPAVAPLGGSITGVRIAVARPGAELHLPGAVLYLAWLTSRLGWRVERPLTAHGRDGADGATTLAASLTRRGQRIDATVVPAPPDPEGRARVPGSLRRVELAAERGGHRARIAVTRSGDELEAEARVDGVSRARRTAVLEPPEDAPHLAAALEAPGGDATLRAALGAAARLLEGAAGSR
jgi:glucose-6-phosphate dehydrogenase assembly protein OpcA